MTDETMTPASTSDLRGAINPVRQQMLYDANRKSVGVAYLLWIFFGGLGGHRFYLGRGGTGFIQLALFAFGWLTVTIGIGIVLLAALGIWLLVDAILIPGMARETNLKLADKLTGD